MNSKVLSFCVGFVILTLLFLKAANCADISSDNASEAHQFVPANQLYIFQNIRHNILAVVERLRTRATDTIHRFTQRPAIVSEAENQRRPFWQRLRERLQQPKPANSTIQPELQTYGALSDKFQVDPLEAIKAGPIETPDKNNTTQI